MIIIIVVALNDERLISLGAFTCLLNNASLGLASMSSYEKGCELGQQMLDVVLFYCQIVIFLFNAFCFQLLVNCCFQLGIVF